MSELVYGSAPEAAIFCRRQGWREVGRAICFLEQLEAVTEGMTVHLVGRHPEAKRLLSRRRARVIIASLEEQEERPMADDKSKRGPRDRSRVAKSQAYEVSYFMRKHGLDRGPAEKIIEEAAGDRDKANQLAAQIRKRRR